MSSHGFFAQLPQLSVGVPRNSIEVDVVSWATCGPNFRDEHHTDDGDCRDSASHRLVRHHGLVVEIDG